MPTNLDLDLLRTFVAGLDLGSFAKAAGHVGRSQSAVSTQLRRLEEQVGQPLLRKQGRGLVPTDAGEVLLSHARRLLAANDEAVAALRRDALAGQVRLGLPQDVVDVCLPDVLARFARGNPGVRLDVVVERSDLLAAQAAVGALDLAVTWGTPGEEGDAIATLAVLPMVWIGMVADGSVQAEVPLAGFEAPCRFRSAAHAALDGAGRPWRLAVSSPSLAGLWAAVAAGLGITARTMLGLPAGLRVLEPGRAGLPALPMVALRLHRAPDPSPAAEHLARLLGGALGETLEGRPGEKHGDSTADRLQP